jgi:hypothetical protein
MPKGHKPDCQCSICVRARNKAAESEIDNISAPQESPIAVPLSSVSVGDRFILNGEKYQAGIKAEGMLMAISIDRPRAGRQMLDLGLMVFLEK